MAYIQSDKTEEGCIFCSAAGQPDSEANLIVFRGRLNFVILNRYPYTSGHSMVVPFEHQPSLEKLDGQVRFEMIELASLATQILGEEYHPDGFNLGMNIGAAAGAGIADHVHMHIVPRWSGDTNFMSSLAETRVLPEALEDTYRRLRRAWLAVG